MLLLRDPLDLGCHLRTHCPHLPLLREPQDLGCHLGTHCLLPATAQGTTGTVVSFQGSLPPASSVSEAGGSGSREDTTSPLGP